MASGLPGHLQRRSRTLLISGCRDIAGDASMEIEHALAPGAQRIVPPEDFLRAHDARPLENREERVVGVGRRSAAHVGLALERGLHRLERATQALQCIVALAARLLE